MVSAEIICRKEGRGERREIGVWRDWERTLRSIGVILAQTPSNGDMNLEVTISCR